MNRLAAAWATCAGIGFIPVAPGTFASLAVVLLHRAVLHRLPPAGMALLIIVVFITGAAASTRYARLLGRKDPGLIVVDEAAGQLTALLALGTDWRLLLSAFLLFRFFDIVKPWPIGRLERLPDGWGIMLDDVAAGIAAAVVLRLSMMIL